MPNCVELANCNITNPLEWMVYPYQLLIGDFIFPIVWAMVIGIVYIRTGNAMNTAVIGIFLMSGLISSNVTLLSNSNTGQIFYWGITIAAVAFGCTIYYLLKVRIHNPV